MKTPRCDQNSAGALKLRGSTLSPLWNGQKSLILGIALLSILLPYKSFGVRDPQCSGCESWSCSTGSINNPGTLSSTNATICIGGSVSAPSVSGTTFNNGSKSRPCYNSDCSTYTDGPHAISYTATNWWEPSIPSNFTTCGTFSYTAKVKGISGDSDCTDPTATATVGTFTVTVVKLTGLSVAGATQVNGSTNWVAVKTSSSTDFVTLTANLCPNTTEAATLLTWSGGDAVPGNPLQRRVPKNTSAKTIVTASCCNTSYTAVVWILWGSISYNFGAALDSDDNLSFANWGNQYATFNFPNPKSAGAFIGSFSVTANGVTTPLLGANTKVEIIGHLSPAGVGDIMGNVFSLNPQRIDYYLWTSDGTRNGHPLTSVTSSTAGTHNGPVDDTALPEQTTPINDKVFALDAPGVDEVSPVTGYEAQAVNFTNYIYYGGVKISDSGTWNSRVKATFSGSTVTASPCSAGSGSPALPTTWGSSNW